MSLPDRNQREYLKIMPAKDGFQILATKEDAAVLTVVFQQRGFPCTRQTDMQLDHDALLFAGHVDKTGVQEILDGFKGAKGS
jgi:hypothetical protein